MAGGYCGKFLFIDLTSGKVSKESFGDGLLRDFLGGYGLGARILYERMNSGADPLGPENLLGVLTGPLTGTSLPFVSRFTVVGKSPLTNCWGDSNGSGFFGPNLKFSGFDGIFVSGVSDNPVYILLSEGECTICDAGQLWGLDTYATEDFIKEKYGIKAEVACIGPAGEKLSRLASVVTAKGRCAARSGLGAVMGSKKLKGIVCIGSSKLQTGDPERVEALRKKYIQQMRDGVGFSNFYKITGTPGHVEAAAITGDSPVRNWFGNATELTDVSEYNFENIKKRYIKKKKTCYRCPMVDWGHVMVDEGPYALKEEAHIPEYESTSALGSYLLNTNYESIIKCNDLCNRYGIDTISTGATVAFATMCYQEGIISKKDTDGVVLQWGKHDAIVQMVEKLCKREGFGDVLADGAKIASERIGKNSSKFAIHVGGQEIPAHDSRFEPSMASIYRNNATPGRHTQDAQYCVPQKLAELYPDIDFSFSFGNKRETMKGRAKAQRILSALNHCVNASGACLFGFLSTEADFLPECISAVTGWDISLDELIETGERIGAMRMLFTVREGINPLKLPYPDIALGKPALKAGPTKGISVDLDLLTAEFCQEMGWDIESGMPNKSKLTELGLDNIFIKVK